MKTCVCHNISDKSIQSVLANFFHGVTIITKRRGDLDGHTQEKGNLDDLHEACSSGKGFNCGKCACAIADLALDHNRNITMNQLKDSLPGLTEPVAPAPLAARKTTPAF